jgi:cytochrome b involved in lipid metabolism
MKLHLVYHTFECEHCSEDECILNNQFCSYDFDSFHPGHGKFIVNEQYRQFNLFKELKKEQ